MNTRTWTPSLWLAGTAALLAMAAALLGTHPDVDAMRALIRATARTSLLCFVLAYMASTWWRRWPSALSRGLLAHRRSWGLLFASSHALHAAGIVALAGMAEPELFARLTPTDSRVVGGVGYVALVALALTSSDRTVRWLGRPRWQVLHRWGGHLIWLVFFLSMAKRAPASPWHGVVALLTMKVWHGRPSPQP